MRTVSRPIFICLIAALLAASCSSSRRCNCPTWGDVESFSDHTNEICMTPVEGSQAH